MLIERIHWISARAADRSNEGPPSPIYSKVFLPETLRPLIVYQLVGGSDQDPTFSCETRFCFAFVLPETGCFQGFRRVILPGGSSLPRYAERLAQINRAAWFTA